MKKAFATITLFDRKDGGRRVAIPATQFKCPLFFKGIKELSGHGYDCRMLVNEHGKKIEPGEAASSVPIIFLSSDEVFLYIKEGTKFDIWEMGVIGNGIITSIS